MKRLITIITIALALYILVTFTGIPSEEADPVEPGRAAPQALNILAILPLSGDDLDLGAAQQYGISRGTIQPRNQPINLHIEDSRSDPEHAVAILRERRNTHTIHALIVSGSECVLAIAPYAEEWGIPMAAIAAPLQPEVERGRSRISFTPPIATEIDAIAPFISDYSDIAFIYPDSREGREMAEQILSLPIAQGIRSIEYTQESEDYSDLMQPLRVTPPEIFIIYGDRQVPALISAIRSRGANPVILVWERASVRLLVERPELAEGVFVIAPGTDPSNPVFSGIDELPFRMAPGIVAEAYDAAYTLSSGIASCEGAMECIMGWYWNRTYKGALGTVSFNERREAVYPYEIRQIRRGETETVGMITAPKRTVSIVIDTGGAEPWFVSDVKKGVEPALSIINEQTTIALPLARTTGIPAIFDATVEAVYDGDDIPDGMQIIGSVLITPDGKTAVSSGMDDKKREIGIDTEAYINLCFDLLDRERGTEADRSISLLSGSTEDPECMIVRTIAESRGYHIPADVTYHEREEISSAIDSIIATAPDTPLFVSARTPDEAVDIQQYVWETGYAPDRIFTLGDAWKSESFIGRGALFSEGIIAGSVFRRERLGEAQVIRNVNSLMVRQTGQEINDITARAFTGVMMVADATDRAESFEESSIHTALQRAMMTPEYGALYDGTTILVQMKNRVYRTIPST
ncbi:MAG: Receptor family ligand binding region family protein 19 [Methanomicrobiales archaeon 53_19]|jgi:ABC-type branched-subunit amino acid transport system substrate-binding protein|uniref:ABC transporter substrate-binding protein n=1 Tax=Methanocalculus sp. TaxID=2004547 RepID=UPI000748EC73|nr:ABC transporter substrate-binding protein [Methanocalculus sp.]KUK70012.1 MAG: Receptor family ligand binding region family protein 19 [Methanocalculus sp. 52_23]KUL03795.1 MAG: Receptor family ligand binding region family protein 19 [Methanomicrobiales archaeon 53_19]HIJ07508.1 ABC transporter substrate-binding protein [Methanocalculus sp.]